LLYTKTITTVKATPKTSPTITVLPVTTGLVYKVEIIFPSGSAGLLGVSIYDGGHQVWPSNLDEWFIGDNIAISFEDLYLKESDPSEFKVRTYNIDDTYNHQLTVCLGLVSKEEFMAKFLPHIGYKYFAETLSAFQNQQQVTQQERTNLVLENPFGCL